MKENELRIGNYYKAGLEIKGSREARLNLMDTERTICLTIGHFQVFCNAPMIVEMLQPIPLTEEWLKKFSFTTTDAETDFMEYCKYYEQGSYLLKIQNDGGLNNTKEFPFYYEVEGQDKGWCRIFKQEIKYVHQLQNLYCALTGEEL